MRIPTIIKPAKGLLSSPLPPGSFVEEMVEEVDIYPSLVDLHGLEVPADLEGTSWVPLLTTASAPGKQRVFSQYPHFLAPDASKHGFAKVRKRSGFGGRGVVVERRTASPVSTRRGRPRVHRMTRYLHACICRIPLWVVRAS